MEQPWKLESLVGVLTLGWECLGLGLKQTRTLPAGFDLPKSCLALCFH